MTTVETRVIEMVLPAIDTFVIHRVDLAMKTTNTSSVRSVDTNVLEPD